MTPALWVSASTFGIWANPNYIFTLLTTLKKKKYSSSQRASMLLAFSYPHLILTSYQKAQKATEDPVYCLDPKSKSDYLQVSMQNCQHLFYMDTKENPDEGSKESLWSPLFILPLLTLSIMENVKKSQICEGDQDDCAGQQWTVPQSP